MIDTARQGLEDGAWRVLRTVEDPELPALSLVDLGIIRRVSVDVGGTLEVDLSPTYAGCPATSVIRSSVIAALKAAGYEHVKIQEVLAPAWTSDWISAEGREKLERCGIAPPEKALTSTRQLWSVGPTLRCPRCQSRDTRELSPFGSTPCKALYRCDACLEPFEYFKCH